MKTIKQPKTYETFKKLYDQGKYPSNSTKPIETDFGISYHAAKRWLAKAERGDESLVTFRSREEKKKLYLKFKKDYDNGKLPESNLEISRIYNIHYSTVYRWLEMAGNGLDYYGEPSDGRKRRKKHTQLNLLTDIPDDLSDWSWVKISGNQETLNRVKALTEDQRTSLFLYADNAIKQVKEIPVVKYQVSPTKAINVKVSPESSNKWYGIKSIRKSAWMIRDVVLPFLDSV